MAGPFDDVALVLCSHGIAGGPGAAVDHVQRLRSAGFREVAAACLNGSPALAATLDATTASRIVLVPFLMAAGRAFNVVLPDRLAAARRRGDVRVAAPVGTHPDIARLADTLATEALAQRGWRADEALLLLVAHGTTRDPQSGEAARDHVRAILAAGRFAAVEAGYLDEPPAISDLLVGRRVAHAVGIGLFADAGPHGAGDAAAPFTADPAAVYAGPLGLDSRLTAIVLARVTEALGP
ncbi:MAG: CbiX/SirB N-terminal domain-containing protein [Rhodospirillaceae bacterium]|nr:CbiX/SirB N-terminal domain-containing protein [Rhodospirillaceae bacterium]